MLRRRDFLIGVLSASVGGVRAYAAAPSDEAIHAMLEERVDIGIVAVISDGAGGRLSAAGRPGTPGLSLQQGRYTARHGIECNRQIDRLAEPASARSHRRVTSLQPALERRHVVWQRLGGVGGGGGGVANQCGSQTAK